MGDGRRYDVSERRRQVGEFFNSRLLPPTQIDSQQSPVVGFDHDQIAMKGFQSVRHPVRFEVSDIRMRHWMLPEKSAQVRNHFEGMPLCVDTKNRIGEIRIPVAASTSSCKGVKLA